MLCLRSFFSPESPYACAVIRHSRRSVSVNVSPAGIPLPVLIPWTINRQLLQLQKLGGTQADLAWLILFRPKRISFRPNK
jgi:hypothetical protein